MHFKLFKLMYICTHHLSLHLIKHVYKLTCSILQINEANIYEKYGFGLVFKQIVNKVSLEIIILVKLYG